jgi:hypothetical protein
MARESGGEKARRWSAHRVTWFTPDRPVEGATVFVLPASDESDDQVGDRSGRRTS